MGRGAAVAVRVPRIRRGSPITSGYLNNISDNINQAYDSVHGPKTTDNPTETDGDGEPIPEQWTEVERTTTTVRVENPDDATQYVDVERIETITFSLADSTRVELTFNNT